jgi:hypothetical protein
MDALKKLFPLSWKYAKDVSNLIIGVIVYLVVGLIAGAVIWLATAIISVIPLIGGLVAWVLGIIGGLVDIYVIAGIVVLVLAYLKVFND